MRAGRYAESVAVAEIQRFVADREKPIIRDSVVKERGIVAVTLDGIKRKITEGIAQCKHLCRTVAEMQYAVQRAEMTADDGLHRLKCTVRVGKNKIFHGRSKGDGVVEPDNALALCKGDRDARVELFARELHHVACFHIFKEVNGFRVMGDHMQ